VHDLHAVEALIARLGRELEDLGIARVETVRVRTDATFTPEALTQAYEMLTPGTALEGSTLVVEVAPIDGRCPACGTTWAATPDDLAGHLLVCPSCGVPSPLGEPARLELLGIGAPSAGSGP